MHTLVLIRRRWPPYLRQPYELEYFAVNQWVDVPSRMLEPLLVQTLEQREVSGQSVRTPIVVSADLRLDTELIRLQQISGRSAKPGAIYVTGSVDRFGK